MPQFGGNLVNNQSSPTGWYGFDFGFDQEDWLEAVALYSPTQLAMGRKRSHATLTGYIPFTRIAGAVKFFLGFSWVDFSRGFPILSRVVPATHPVFPSLHATELQECVGVKFITKVAAPHKWSLPYAKYTLARVTIGYSQPPYPILADEDLDTATEETYQGQEMRRWCNWSPKPYVDMLEMPGGMYVFNAPNVQINGNNLDGTQLPGPRFVFRAEKQTRKMTWYNVPEEYIMNDYGYMPKIDAAVGKVNSDVFFGDPLAGLGSPGWPHTWLLEDVDTVNSEVYADPIASAAFEGFTRRLDVVFTFKHFNPPNGDQESSEAGWRLALAADGKYYPVKNKVTGSPLAFPAETSFLKLFTHWSDT